MECERSAVSEGAAVQPQRFLFRRWVGKRPSNLDLDTNLVDYLDTLAGRLPVGRRREGGCRGDRRFALGRPPDAPADGPGLARVPEASATSVASSDPGGGDGGDRGILVKPRRAGGCVVRDDSFLRLFPTGRGPEVSLHRLELAGRRASGDPELRLLDGGPRDPAGVEQDADLRRHSVARRSGPVLGAVAGDLEARGRMASPFSCWGRLLARAGRALAVRSASRAWRSTS